MGKEELQELLARIGWGLRGCGLGHYLIIDHRGESSGVMFYVDRITLARRVSDNISVTFYLKDCVVEEMPPGDTICIRGKQDKSIFILLHNFDS